jgi:hypothetical protein
MSLACGVDLCQFLRKLLGGLVGGQVRHVRDDGVKSDVGVVDRIDADGVCLFAVEEGRESEVDQVQCLHVLDYTFRVPCADQRKADPT